MNDLERRTLLGAAGLGALAAISKAGGPLEPPAGSVSPTGRTLEEVYNKIPAIGGSDGRIPIPGGNASVTITQPGSYVLTGNIVISEGHSGISIFSHNVTLDLNGHHIRNDGPTVLTNGLRINDALSVTVRNGGIAGFLRGVYIESLTRDILVEDLMVRNPAMVGLQSLGACTVVRRCQFLDLGGGSAQNAVTGISFSGSCSVADQCIVARFISAAPSPAYSGIQTFAPGATATRCIVSNGTVVAGSIGLDAGPQSTYRDNTVINMATKYTGAGLNGGGNV